MIFETIISTVNAQGTPHVTPFGVRYENDLIVISPYRPSATLDNILVTQHAVMNLTDDVRVFAGALTNRQVWTLLPAERVNGLRLADILAHKELKLVHVVDDVQRPQLFMQIVHEVQHYSFKGFNRAQACLLYTSRCV